MVSFPGIYCCPGGTPQKPCEYQTTYRGLFAKHVQKEHNIHYTSFGGKSKKHGCETCSASSNDIDVIKGHTLKVHNSSTSIIKLNADPVPRIPSSKFVNNDFKPSRNRNRKSPKAKKALYIDTEFTLSTKTETNEGNYQTMFSDHSKFELSHKPVKTFDRPVKNFEHHIDCICVRCKNKNIRKTSLSPVSVSRNSTKFVQFSPNPYYPSVGKQFPATSSTSLQSMYTTSYHYLGNQFSYSGSSLQNELRTTLQPNFISSPEQQYNVRVSNDVISQTQNSQRAVFKSPENSKLYLSLLSLSPKYKDNNNNKIQSSPKSGLTCVEEAIRNLQNQVDAGKFQPSK